MTDLITKLEEAGEGSRELNIELGQALGFIDSDLTYTSADGTRSKFGNTNPWRPWTQSLDAALALAERLGLDVPQLLNDALEGPSGLWARGWRSDRPLTPQIATALCAAILRASEEKQS